MTASSPLESYLAGVDPVAAPVVRALDDAIRAAHPEFGVAVKYGLLMYAVHDDWRTWVCAVGTSTKGVQLRYLYGVLLDDPLQVLRKGSSVLMSWDHAFDATVDRAAVVAYTQEAVRRYDEYVADADAIQAKARAAGTAPAKRGAGRGTTRAAGPSA